MKHTVIRMTNIESITEVYNVLKQDSLNLLADFKFDLEIKPHGGAFSHIYVEFAEWMSEARQDSERRWLNGMAFGILLSRNLPAS